MQRNMMLEKIDGDTDKSNAEASGSDLRANKSVEPNTEAGGGPLEVAAGEGNATVAVESVPCWRRKTTVPTAGSAYHVGRLRGYSTTHAAEGPPEIPAGESNATSAAGGVPLWRRSTTVPNPGSTSFSCHSWGYSAAKTVMKVGSFYYSGSVMTKLSYDQRVLTGSVNPGEPQAVKSRPWLVVEDLENEIFRVVSCTTRSGKGWEGIPRRFANSFLAVKPTPSKFNREALSLLDGSGKERSKFSMGKSLIYLGASTTGHRTQFGGYLGELAPEAIEIVQKELASLTE